MVGMRPRQSFVDLLFIVLLGLGVLNFFSPAIGVERDPIITYAFVGLAGVVFGVGRGGPGGGSPRTRDNEIGDS